ncbi:MAG: hypothetical protein V4613_07485 [Bacteroidota bacterium]
MKKFIKHLFVISTLSLVLFVQSCKEPCHEPDPCLKPETVTALSVDYYSTAHFSTTEGNLLFATNWDEYKDKVVPGQSYEMGYTETDCGPRTLNYPAHGIKEGGCVVPQKCIVIECLTLIEEPKCNDCQASVVNPSTYDTDGSTALNSTGINGNYLNALVGYSGCTDEPFKDYRLHLKHLPLGESLNDIFVAKAVNINADNIICQAYWEKEVCFDLSAIKAYFTANGTSVPEKVIIRLENRDNTTQDFTYHIQ